MRVILAKSAGFCYGVERAVKLAEQTARDKGGCVMLGSIIHNAHVVQGLAALGARQVDDPAQVQAGDTVIIRSHGEKKQVYQQLEAAGASIVDATCPNVRRIQRLVAQAEEQGRTPLIIGEQHHPEVIGAASWAENSVILDGPEALENWLSQRPERRERPLMAAAQTTCIRVLWENCVKILKKQCTNVEIFDTICDATHKRQSEAADIAAKVDVMVVVGDRKSANTKHLTEICSERCPVVCQIERAEELKGDFLNGCSVAGLTAGASTPAGIIKEVYATMSEEIKNMEATEESFEEMLEKSFKTLNTGEKVTGIVTAIGPTEVQVDLGCKQAGYINIDELSADPSVKPEDVVKVGDEIETYIIRVNDVEGYAMLSKKRLDAVKVWEDIEKAREEKTTLEGKVTEENKGGIVVNVKGVRVFVPASQSGLPRGAELSAAGQTGLGSGHEHAHALDVDHDAALVLLGDLALQSSLLLTGLLDVLPDLDSVQTLLGQHGIALHVVDADDIGLDLVADLHHILRLHAGIGGQLVDVDITCLLAAQVNLHLGGTDGSHDTGYLLSCIQSLKRFFQHFLEALFRSFHVLDLFAHRCIYLLNDARRRGRAGCKPRHRTSVKKVTLEFFRPLDLTDHGAPLAANLR